MNQKNQIWAQYGGQYYLEYPSIEHGELSNGIYTVKWNQDRGCFYLERIADEYVFDYKIYGLESKLIDRVEKTYANTTNNLGILLNGVKGTGKTVTCKQIANRINQPVIVVSQPYKGVQYFLNSIPQNITIFVDEYEKIFGQSNELLTIMDGAMNSEFKRVFLLTTNKMYIEDNLKQRPSRLRYLKHFKDLAPEIVEEIVDDVLEHKQLKEECISFITSLSLITVDIVKQIINEVNIHNESPHEFGDIFNVVKVNNNYKVFEVIEDGEDSLLIENIEIYPSPEFNSNHIGYSLDINNGRVGNIINILGPNIIEVQVTEYDDDTDKEIEIETVVLRIEKSYGTHSNYAYAYGGDINKPKSTKRAMELTNRDIKKKTLLYRNYEASETLIRPKVEPKPDSKMQIGFQHIGDDYCSDDTEMDIS